MVTIELWMIMAIIAVSMMMALICVVIGAFIMFKGKSAISGEGFFGHVPKGQVFSIPEAEEGQEFPEDEKMMDKTKRFLENFALGGN